MDLSKIRIEQGMILFYGSFLSQWYRVDIIPEFKVCQDDRIVIAEEVLLNVDLNVDGISFPSAEHFMMYCKAMLMCDIKTANKILYTDSPKKAQELGRTVKNYNNDLWIRYREYVVLLGSYFKFQNTELKENMLEVISICKEKSNGKFPTFVEASPNNIWGIGLYATDNKSLCISNWTGLNLLGKQLTIVADIISNEPY